MDLAERTRRRGDPNVWTDPHVDDLKRLWADGLSASQIQKELNNSYNAGYTRSAVIGKVHRLGLSGRVKVKKLTSDVPGPRRSPGRRRLAFVPSPTSEQHRQNIEKAKAFEDATPVVDAEIPQTQRVHLIELRDGHCRWPVGDPRSPDFFYCGGKRIEGFPYCAHHSRVAYQPATDRRR